MLREVVARFSLGWDDAINVAHVESSLRLGVRSIGGQVLADRKVIVLSTLMVTPPNRLPPS